MTAKVVLVEGMDGSGKSTLVRKLADNLKSRGLSVATFAFPTKTSPVGRFIRKKLFTGEEVVELRAMAPLMLADALDAEPDLIEAQETHDVVIMDRHTIVSMWVYQAEVWLPSDLGALAHPSYFQVLPDLIAILDVPASVSMERRAQRDEPTNPLYEKDLEHAAALRSRYTAWAALSVSTCPVVLLDGELQPHALVHQVKGLLDLVG